MNSPMLNRIIKRAAISDQNTVVTFTQAMAALHLANIRFQSATFMVPDEDNAIQEVEAIAGLVKDLTMKIDARAKALLGPSSRPQITAWVNKLTTVLRQ